MTLQLADRSITRPYRVIEDVLVRVNHFIFPVDFVVMDIFEDIDIPVILGRPFMLTASCIVDMGKRKLELGNGRKSRGSEGENQNMRLPKEVATTTPEQSLEATSEPSAQVVNLPSPQPASHPSTPLLQIPEDPTTPVLVVDTSPPTTPVLQLTNQEDGQTQETHDKSQEF
ncbi:uncharacterized protein [Glycine max]|uniref:uncharacterized protein n=1 Tax=Glycine max TaxID=3847 RepID=UPI0003DE99AE|nr:uncharacterized protein LOC100801997 [Glycine max]|eukprot:XP_006588151.1 uncharacterized protein LOC100801997 [Glycine max]